MTVTDRWRQPPTHSGWRKNLAQNVPVALARVISKECRKGQLSGLDASGRCVLTCFSDSFPCGCWGAQVSLRPPVPQPGLLVPLGWYSSHSPCPVASDHVDSNRASRSVLSPLTRRQVWWADCWASGPHARTRPAGVRETDPALWGL